MAVSLLEGLLEVHGHEAAVVQAGQTVGDGHLHGLLHGVAQAIGIVLAANLGGDAGLEFLAVDRADEVVVDAHVEAAHQAGAVVRFGEEQDRQHTGAFDRAQLGDQAQAVEVGEAERDDDEIEVALGGAEQRLLGIGLDGEGVDVAEPGLKALERGAAIVDDQDLALGHLGEDARIEAVVETEVAIGG